MLVGCDGIHSTISTPLWLGDHIYGIDSYGMLRCLRADTGDRVWADSTAVRLARWSTAHLIPQRGTDRIWILNEEGELLLARLSPQGFEVISRTHIIEPTTDQLNRRALLISRENAVRLVCAARECFGVGDDFSLGQQVIVFTDG